MQLTANNQDEVAQLFRLVNTYGTAGKMSASLVGSDDLLLGVLHSNLWPKAVPESLIVKDYQIKKIRASAVISAYIAESMAGKRFLDFGCGEGHCVAEATRLGAIATGYDLNEQNWQMFSDLNLTTDYSKIVAGGPYDIILLYDVIDHIKDITPVQFLINISKLMSPTTKLYARFHPFTAVHGTHLYTTLNKAYAHLLFDDNVLREMGGTQEHTIQTYPTKNVKEAGLKIVGEPSRTIIRPHDFFVDEFILKRLNDRHFGNKFSDQNILDILSVQFVDLVLQK